MLLSCFRNTYFEISLGGMWYLHNALNTIPILMRLIHKCGWRQLNPLELSASDSRGGLTLCQTVSMLKSQRRKSKQYRIPWLQILQSINAWKERGHHIIVWFMPICYFCVNKQMSTGSCFFWICDFGGSKDWQKYVVSFIPHGVFQSDNSNER